MPALDAVDGQVRLGVVVGTIDANRLPTLHARLVRREDATLSSDGYIAAPTWTLSNARRWPLTTSTEHSGR